MQFVNAQAYKVLHRAEERGWTKVFVTPPSHVMKPKTLRSDGTIVALLICNQLRCEIRSSESETVFVRVCGSMKCVVERELMD